MIDEKIALPFAIYHDETLVGFVMFGYGSEEGDPAIAENNYLIWRLMVDQNFQGKGIGKKAVKAALDFLQTGPCGQAEYCWLSYEPENITARKLYASVGFEETGELCESEVVAVKKLATIF